MLENKKMKKQRNNKGFSLVELIVVIAIMAVLVGVVGMQVIPYIEKSKEAKDYQIISAYCTAAVTAYASNAGTLKDSTIDFDMYGGTLAGDKKTVYDAMVPLVSYAGISDLTDAMGSKEGKLITNINVNISVANKEVTVSVKGADDAKTKELKTKFPDVISKL